MDCCIGRWSIFNRGGMVSAQGMVLAGAMGACPHIGHADLDHNLDHDQGGILQALLCYSTFHLWAL